MAKRVKKLKTDIKSGFSEEDFIDFIYGIIIFFILELVFMLGGLYLEKKLGFNATGIPSLLGLVVWIILGMYSSKKYLLMGGLVTSILVPIILIIVTITGFVAFSSMMYYSIALFIILELIYFFILSRK